MRSFIFLATVLCVLVPTFAMAQTGAAGYTQPPLRALVTVVTPDGQFYIDAGQKLQLYRRAELVVVRDGRDIALARVRKVNYLDAVAELHAEYRGLRLQAGDMVRVISNPIPVAPRKRLPFIEPNDDMREREFAMGLFVIGVIAAALIH